MSKPKEFRDELKQDLLERGCWSDYVMYRAELKAHGIINGSREFALLKYARELLPKHFPRFANKFLVECGGSGAEEFLGDNFKKMLEASVSRQTYCGGNNVAATSTPTTTPKQDSKQDLCVGNSLVVGSGSPEVVSEASEVKEAKVDAGVSAGAIVGDGSAKVGTPVIADNKQPAETAAKPKPTTRQPKATVGYELPKPNAAGGGAGKVTRHTFGAKKCGIVTSFLWAYENLAYDEVFPADAPSAIAWQLYCDMKQSNAMKSELVRAGLASAIKKAEADNTAQKDFDGQHEYDLLGAMASIDVVSGGEASAKAEVSG